MECEKIVEDAAITLPVLGPLRCSSFKYAEGEKAKTLTLLCVKSLCPVYDPVQCKNGHLNCRICLSECHGMACPTCCEDDSKTYGSTICHKETNKEDGFGIAPKGLVAMLDSLIVICQDCGKTVQRSRYLHHCNEECFVLCPFGCGTSTSRATQATHVNICNKTAVKCHVGCEWRGMQSDLFSHQNSCMVFQLAPVFRAQAEMFDKLIARIDALERHIVLNCARPASLNHQVYTAIELKSANYTIPELKAAGYTARELKTAGFPAIKLKENGYTLAELRSVGATAAELISAPCTAQELKDVGYTAAELKSAGYNSSDVKSAGYSALDLKSGGYTGTELKNAGYSISEIKRAGCTVNELKSARYNITDIATVYTLAELTPEYTATELKNAGFLK